MRRQFKMTPVIMSAMVAGSLLLSACGRNDDLPSDMSSALDTLSTSSTASNMSQSEIAAALPKIMEGLEEIKDKLDNIKLAPTTATKPSTTTKPTTKPTPKPTASTKPNTKPTPKPTASESEDDQGQADFEEMLSTLSAAPFTEANVEKVERNLKTGKVTTNKIKMVAKAPATVLINVLSSSSGATGTRVTYTSGSGSTVKVRPSGALSFVTTDLPKTDDRIISNNGYKLDDNDLFGVVKRFKSGYNAELVGTTTLSGTKINVLKVTPKNGTNVLDSRITHEHIGYEPGTFKIRLWEMYAADSKDPFFRMSIALNLPSSLPDSAFKL
jgi:hypothetical protein